MSRVEGAGKRSRGVAYVQGVFYGRKIAPFSFSLGLIAVGQEGNLCYFSTRRRGRIFLAVEDLALNVCLSRLPPPPPPLPLST